jgi:glycosyltransferase involved in cell wall biosynthesis
MKLLFIAPYLPGPPIFGGQRRIHGMMTCLARSHELSVIALTDGYVDQRASELEAKQYCKHVISVPQRYHRLEGANKRLTQLRSLLSHHSWERRVYKRLAVQRAIDQHLAAHSYDAIICEFAFMADYQLRRARERTRLVLDEHNIEYDLLRRSAVNATFERKLFHAVNWRKLKHEEVRAWKRFDGCTLTSRRDQALVNAGAPGVPTAVVPNGVDIATFCPREVAEAPETLLFFGAINYYPNSDAAVSFTEQVLPLLRPHFPRLRVRIVGPIGEAQIKQLEGPQIELVGFVEDLQAEIARASVVIAPLRIGGGTRLKILEAMAMGKAIVATRIGAEGLDVKHGHDILLADSPVEQAREIRRLLDDPGLRAHLGHNARTTAVASYSWAASARKLDDFLCQLAQGPDTSVGR